MILIINLNMGNIGSWKNILTDLDLEFNVANSISDISKDYDVCILPGVGTFNSATQELDKRGFRKFLKSFHSEGKKIIGVCLGMQLLFESSEEGKGNGLGLIQGKVIKFANSKEYKSMRMGWGLVKFNSRSNYYPEQIKRFYFCHSYHCIPNKNNVVIGNAYHGLEYNCIVKENNVWGIQFHPEKSGKEGLYLIKHILEKK